MSILNKMITLNKNTDSEVICIVKVCPTGYVPVLVEKNQRTRRNGRLYASQTTLYVPEYYNYVEVKRVCEMYWDKEDPITTYKTPKQMQYRKDAILECWYFHVEDTGSSLQWGRLMNDENEKVAKKYRQGLTDVKIEWGVPLCDVSPVGYKLWTTQLDEDIHYFTYEECRVKFLESGGSFSIEEVA